MAFVLLLLASAHLIYQTLAQNGVVSPLIAPCEANLNNVVCVNHYASVMPYPFQRPILRNGSVDPQDTFQGTNVPNDASFSLAKNASFIVFDKSRGLAILGPNPTNNFMFVVSPSIHEAPVYLPSLNQLIFSEFAYGIISQFIVDLNVSPPTLSRYTSNPPVLGINGGTYHNGLIYWAVSGSKPINGTFEEPGIVALNITSHEVFTVLNNYYGTYFNSPNDLIFDANGDLFFTDALYGWQTNITTQAPALETAIYRFCLSTGVVSIIDNGLVEPNGIAFSLDQKTLYVGDSGAIYSSIYGPPDAPVITPIPYNATQPRTVYAYDVRDSPVGKYAINRRPFWVTQESIPDGLKVAANGYVLVAAGKGYVVILKKLLAVMLIDLQRSVDVLDEWGTYILRVTTNFTVNNFAFAGRDLKQLWMVGQRGVAMVKWELQGVALA